MGANIPGKPREQLNYLGGVEEYELECRKALENLEGFTVVHEVETRCNGDRGQVQSYDFCWFTALATTIVIGVIILEYL